jgi:nucleotide-binding universal stress UspA family protein
MNIAMIPETVFEPLQTKKVRFQTILFATDFSAGSQAALREATATARAYEARLLVLHVLAPETLYDVIPEGAVLEANSRRRWAETEMTQLLISGALCDILHEVRIVQGPMDAVLANTIQTENVDLVVVGSHGLTSARKLVFGSVAEHIFRTSPCPVLVVGPKSTTKGRLGRSVHSVLWATSLSSDDDPARYHALSLAQEHQARLTLIHVWQESQAIPPHDAEGLRREAAQKLEKLLPDENGLWFPASMLLMEGSPEEEIVAAARAVKADRIVMGVRRGHPHASHLPGTIAYAVVRHAPCPVLIVPK